MWWPLVSVSTFKIFNLLLELAIFFFYLAINDDPQLSALQDLAPADSGGHYTIKGRVLVINCLHDASAFPLNKQLAVSCQAPLDCRPLLVDPQKTRSFFFMFAFFPFALNDFLLCLFLTIYSFVLPQGNGQTRDNDAITPGHNNGQRAAGSAFPNAAHAGNNGSSLTRRTDLRFIFLLGWRTEICFFCSFCLPHPRTLKESEPVEWSDGRGQTESEPEWKTCSTFWKLLWTQNNIWTDTNPGCGCGHRQTEATVSWNWSLILLPSSVAF